jgi:hypothetical protein
MIVRERRPRPRPWSEIKQHLAHKPLTAFYYLEWLWAWLAFYLSNWAFLEVLEYLGSFSVLVAVIFYFAESGDRLKQKHYQAWQVINTAQGKGGSGGRIEALEELNRDGVDLVGVDLAGAFLQGVRLPKANLLRASFQSADMRRGQLRGADLTYADLTFANLRDGNLTRAKLASANMTDADFFGANLTGADLTGATLDRMDLRNAHLGGIRWKTIGGLRLANIYGVKNAPPGFLEWAKSQGAVQIEADEVWYAALQQR